MSGSDNTAVMAAFGDAFNRQDLDAILAPRKGQPFYVKVLPAVSVDALPELWSLAEVVDRHRGIEVRGFLFAPFAFFIEDPHCGPDGLLLMDQPGETLALVLS